MSRWPIVLRHMGMDITTPAPSCSDRIHDDAWYCTEVRSALLRSTRRPGTNRQDVEDVTGAVLVRLMPALGEIRERYPNPRIYAAAVRASATEDHFRRERAQRGQGARTVTAADGSVSVRREIVPLDDARTMVSPDATSDPVERAVTRSEVRELLAEVPAPLRLLLWRVHAEGESVTDAAAELGWSRSVASRALSAVVDGLRAKVAA
jgi:DNA-directed RNA polymerase specialized sigma24 family protein